MNLTRTIDTIRMASKRYTRSRSRSPINPREHSTRDRDRDRDRDRERDRERERERERDRDREKDRDRDRNRIAAGCLPNSIDRQSTCPLLLRVFCSPNGRHHRAQDFTNGKVPADELQIYTWMDCTLKELMSLVHEVNPDTRQKGTVFSFATVFPYVSGGRRGNSSFRIKEIGCTTAGKQSSDDSHTLASQKFKIGDYIDIAISIKHSESGGKREKDRVKRKEHTEKP